MSDVLCIGMIVGGMAICWLYAVAIDRGMSEGPKVKP